MKVKINDKLLCIPPHISTTWDRVSFLLTEEDPETKNLILIINLVDGNSIRIPNLDPSIIDIIFSAHIKHLEGNLTTFRVDNASKVFPNLIQSLMNLSPDQITGIPIRFGIQGLPGMENLESAFQHNPAQSDTPNLPPEMLEKIISVAKLMTQGDLGSFPKPEPHCNCTHCQIARGIHQKDEEPKQVDSTDEEVVSEEDLRFRTWDITQTGDKLYTVTNPLDPKEQYSVYLGTPLGCTCGETHCEHIRSVLLSN